jgi:putative oxidoreductase
MGTAILAVHLGNGLFNENGGWEYPLTLLLASLVFVVRGGGKHSVDSWVQRGRLRKLIGPVQTNA